MNPTCPRCGARLYIAKEPDVGHCIVHGDQYLGEPLDEPIRDIPLDHGVKPSDYIYKGPRSSALR